MKPAYYNDNDPYCAQWLRNLIAAGHLPAGEVDDRPIQSVRRSDLGRFGQCHFFAGIGGWALALRLAGWPDDRDVWTGSCPCQPFSFAGKRTGFSDERHLFPIWSDLIAECKPAVVLGEQVAHSAGWLDLVQDSLEGMGYAFGAVPIEAASIGAPHRRDRMWFVADAEWHEQSREKSCCGSDRRVGREQQLLPWDGGWQQALARFRVVDDGIPRCVEATDAARNAIVPQVAAQFIAAVMECRP